MFIFKLPQIHGFLKAISVLTETFDETFDLKFSPAIFSIMAAASPSSRCIISLQLSPRIFSKYVCPNLYYKFIYFETFYDTMQECQRRGFSSLTFSFQEQDHDDKLAFIRAISPHSFNIRSLTTTAENPDIDAHLKYINFKRGCHTKVDFPLHPSSEAMDVGEFDFGTFVSIESQEFINIIKWFSNFDYVLVTLSSSQVKFSYGRTAINLTQEENQCIIGGIEASDGLILFVITLQPTDFFYNVVRCCERVWLFKSNNSSKGVIAAPLGLYAQYLAYFPDRS